MRAIGYYIISMILIALWVVIPDFTIQRAAICFLMLLSFYGSVIASEIQAMNEKKGGTK